jgi:hypothetical protein
MDAQAWMGTIVGGITVLGSTLSIGISIGSHRNVRKDLVALDAKVHKHGNKLAGFPDRLDDVYVRKDTIEPQLAAIRKSLEENTAQTGKIFDRLMGGGV